MVLGHAVLQAAMTVKRSAGALTYILEAQMRLLGAVFCLCGVGGGGFFLACEDFGRMFYNSFPACAFFFFLLEISSRTLLPHFRLGSVHSGSAS